METNSSPRQLPPLVQPQSVTCFRNSDDTWYSENEDELLDIWHAVQDSITRRGIVMLDKCRFNHFCAFVMSMTTTRRESCI
ncbi:unnamed protein product [Ectocarpus sp. 12 AP-2014]